MRQTYVLMRWFWVMGVALAACAPSYRPGLPENSPFAESGEVRNRDLPEGIASGDVTHQSALIWSRAEGPTMVQVAWWEASASGSKGPSPNALSKTATRVTHPAQDFTIKVRLDGLRPDTSYYYRIWTAPVEAQDRFGEVAKASGVGSFRTAPLPTEPHAFKFAWSGDLGGQGRCRVGDEGYPIFDHIRTMRPAFMLLLGDLVYGDEICSTPNSPGSGFAAKTLEEYRAKHRYQRGAAALRRFLADVPVWAIWDDHEVRNNFAGPFDSQMPAGRQALLEYWPIETPPVDPTRLYRTVRYGADFEMFVLDTRQYRSRNSDPDGPNKTMLGEAQRRWLIDALKKSDATWKVIATSVPLSNDRKSHPLIPGNDGWARAEDGTGFQEELSMIVRTILESRIPNVVWLSGDVHYVQGNAYDPDGDGTPDFHEFISGPLSASPGRLVSPAPALRPTSYFSETGFFNFGVVTVTSRSFRVDIVDGEGKVRYSHTLTAR